MKSQLFQRGQAAIALSMALPVIVGAACIGADSWALHRSAVSLQALVDEAVMTGAEHLPVNPALAERAALSKALLIGIDANEIVYNRPAADGRSITMVVQRDVPYRFARLLGLAQTRVIVKAMAAGRMSESAVDLVPIGIQFARDSTRYRTRRAIVLQPPSTAPSAAGGMWRPLEMGSCYSGCIAPHGGFDGSQSAISVGDVLKVQAADRIGAIRSALSARLDMGARTDPGASATNYATGDPRRIEVPLVEFRSGSQDATGSIASVRGFATLWLASIDAEGNISAELLHSPLDTTPDLKTGELRSVNLR